MHAGCGADLSSVTTAVGLEEFMTHAGRQFWESVVVVGQE